VCRVGRFGLLSRLTAMLSAGDCVMAGSPENASSKRYRAAQNEAKVSYPANSLKILHYSGI
jgi:hypothetical protein